MADTDVSAETRFDRVMSGGQISVLTVHVGDAAKAHAEVLEGFAIFSASYNLNCA